MRPAFSPEPCTMPPARSSPKPDAREREAPYRNWNHAYLFLDALHPATIPGQCRARASNLSCRSSQLTF